MEGVDTPRRHRCAKMVIVETNREKECPRWRSTIGLDVAKNVFQADGTDATGATAFRKQLRRKNVLEFFGKQPICMVAMEACAVAHYWAREIGKLGHTVKLIPPAYVKPFVKRQKSDVADDKNTLPEAAQSALVIMVETLRDLEGRVKRLDHEIARRAREDEDVRRLATIPGVGPIAATALIALARRSVDLQKRSRLCRVARAEPLQRIYRRKAEARRNIENGRANAMTLACSRGQFGGAASNPSGYATGLLAWKHVGKEASHVSDRCPCQ